MNHLAPGMRFKKWSMTVVLRAVVLAIIAAILLHNNFLTASAACNRNVPADRAWVSHAYKRVMGHNPTSNEVAFVATGLSNRQDYMTILSVFANSDKRIQIEVSETYTRLLDRQPSATNLNYWVSYTKKNSLPKMAASIAASPEYFTSNGGTNESYVQAVFSDMLLRSADTTSLNYWTNRLDNGDNRWQVALHVGSSAEARDRAADRLFQLVLGRAADKSGRAWIADKIRAEGALNASRYLAVNNEFWAQAQRAAGLPVTTMPGPCKPLPPTPTRWQPPVGKNTNSLAQHPNTSRKLIALTFDDGPNSHTASILNILKSHNVPATFFVLGNSIPGRTSLLKRMKSEGHAVATHTMSHPQLTKLSPSGQRNEIVGGIRSINNVLGAGTVKCMRPPYGSYNQTTLNIARENGIASVNWSRDTNDWRNPGTSAIIAAATDSSRDGGRGIVLMHDRAQTKDYLNQLITTLRSQGYTFVNIC